MTNKKTVKKVQISIPCERYPEIEKLWKDLGFSSVAEAGKFLIMNNVDEFFRQVKKSQKAISKLNDLKSASKDTKVKVAPVQPKKHTSEVVSKEALTSGYIPKGSLEYNRIVSSWRKQNPSFNEPNQVKGLRWYIDKGTQKKKMVWWL
jgi:hypothetical protein